jgi:hypothetical protein
MHNRTRELLSARYAALGFLAAVSLAGCTTAQGQPSDDARTTAVYNTTTGRLEQLVSDRDGDGKPDTRAHMEGTTLKWIEIDRDGDGKSDRWEYYSPAPAGAPRGTPPSVIDRADEAGAADQKVTRREHYQRGVLQRTEEDTDRDGRMDKWEFYDGNVLTRVEFDLSGHGHPDRRLVYGPDGNVIRIEVDPDGDGKFEAAPVPPAGKGRGE